MPSGIYVRTKEHNKKISESMKGRHLSEEIKQKISIGNKGKKCSPETRKNISIGKLKRKERLGYINSPEARKNMSIASQKRKKRDGYIQSPEARKKISEKLKGIIFTDERKKNLREGQQRRKERDGYMQSPEARKKISDALKGKKKKPFTEETKKKIGDGNRGKIVSEETKQKISEANKGNKSWNEGLTKEIDERLKKISEKIKGDKHYNWNPNRAEVYAPYGENFYNNNIRNRKWNLQNGRDMLTGTILDPNKRSAYHHIDYNKSNDDPDNHCILSSSNHSRITAKRSNPIKSERYKKILQENILALKKGVIPKYWSQINKELFRQEKLKQLDLSSYII